MKQVQIMYCVFIDNLLAGWIWAYKQYFHDKSLGSYVL